MRAVVFKNGHLSIGSVPEPRMGPEQLRVTPIATGICGSDLTAREHTAEFLQWNADIGATGTAFDPDEDVVFGHEFTSLVTAVGADVDRYEVGDRIVTLPHAIGSDGVRYTVGYSNQFPGGLADSAVVEAAGHIKIPDGVCPVDAAVTEPMATGVNGVLRSRIEVSEGAIVTGCGPVGLGAVVELSARNIWPIIASDPSARRRESAIALGADFVVDPSVDDPVELWRDVSGQRQPLCVYEASGRPGLLNQLLYALPHHSRIIVVGVCATDDVIRPAAAVSKNISMTFVGGPGANDTAYHAFEAMFRHIVRGRFDMTAVVTGYTGWEGVTAVFDSLRPGNPHDIEHVKVLICKELNTGHIQRSLTEPTVAQ